MKLAAKQTQSLTPQQMQTIQLLQFSALELEEYIRELALDNPLVEPEEPVPPPEEAQDDKLTAKLRWLEENDRQNHFYQRIEDEELDPLARVATDGGLEETLYRFIARQLPPLGLAEDQAQAVLFLAACLDRNGYLSAPLEELARDVGTDVQALEPALEILRGLEPAGVGAADLSECLALQLRRLAVTGPAADIVRDHLEALARHRYRSIAAKLDIPLAQVMQAAHTIRELEPRPGAMFLQPEQVPYIIPDVYVEQTEQGLAARVGQSRTPTFRINAYYRSLLSDSEDREVREYLSAKLHQANNVLWAIGQRERTILRCAQIIAERQSAFFLEGPRALVPLRMVDVAEQMGVHESTVSRAVRGKYLQCVQGVFPMSYFFSRPACEGGKTDMGGAAARSLLVRLIGEEDKRRPLSDQKLADRMREQGCCLSRRTVAKYRDELHIPDAAGRRAGS